MGADIAHDFSPLVFRWIVPRKLFQKTVALRAPSHRGSLSTAKFPFILVSSPIDSESNVFHGTGHQHGKYSPENAGKNCRSCLLSFA